MEANLQNLLRDEILKRIEANPDVYLDIGESYRSDPKICSATLLAYLNKHGFDYGFTKIVDLIMPHMPNFTDHKTTFLRFMAKCNSWLHHGKFVELYMHHFRPEIEQDREFLKEALKLDSFAAFFEKMSPALRMDVELLQLAVETVRDTNIGILVRALPPVALVEHDFILVRALGPGNASINADLIPASFWQNRDFIIRWMEIERRLDIRIEFIPTTFCNDRELCLSLYRKQMGMSQHRSDEIINWISRSLRTDKNFVLECLKWDPRIFQFCEQKLQEDFDVFVEAALAATRGFHSLPSFLHNLRESLMFHIEAIRSKLEAHDEFMTFMACSYKSCSFSCLPLSTLDCDVETARGFNTTIARCLGFHGISSQKRLKRVWDAIVSLAVSGLCRKLIPFIPRQTLLQGVLKAIQCDSSVSLEICPDELWTNRLFVNWASERGKFSKAISDEFSMDRKICFQYYNYHGPDLRTTILPWMSERLKSDKDFVLQCLSLNPIILSYCNKDIQYDFEVLFTAVRVAMVKEDLNGLVESAVKGGWEDALVFFAKSLHAKIEIDKAVQPLFLTTHYFARAPAAKRLIRRYLGIDWGNAKCHELQCMWSHHFVLCLASGSNVAEIGKSYTFWPERKRKASIAFLGNDLDGDSDDDSGDANNSDDA
jgi:hypothetical protein